MWGSKLWQMYFYWQKHVQEKYYSDLDESISNISLSKNISFLSVWLSENEII